MRLPSDLHDLLTAETSRTDRSLNGEIIARLRASFHGADYPLPRSIRDAIDARATAAATSFDAELLRAVNAGLHRGAPPVLMVEISAHTPLAKIGKLLDEALRKLPPDTLVKVDQKP
ncbi:hypothetical protein PBS_43470 [Paraburkholderia sp. 2C]